MNTVHVDQLVSNGTMQNTPNPIHFDMGYRDSKENVFYNYYWECYHVQIGSAISNYAILGFVMIH